MFARALNRFFRLATSREIFLFVGLLLAFITGAMLIEQVRFVTVYASSPEAHKEAEGIVDGLAGVLVAAGVFLESRDTLRKMACGAEGMANTVDARLNEVATQNGMGILIVGLLMEIGTLLIGLPPRVLDVHGLERAIFGTCAALSLVTLLILYDFLKDYVLTYRMKREPLPKATSPTPH